MLNINDLFLECGNHSSRKDGMCLLEAVAYFAGESHSDSPKCACPVIASFGRRTNDWMSATERQLLKPYIHKLMNSNLGPTVSRKRAFLAIDTALRIFLPIAFKHSCLKHDPSALKVCEDLLDTLNPIEDRQSFANVYAVVTALKKEISSYGDMPDLLKIKDMLYYAVDLPDKISRMDYDERYDTCDISKITASNAASIAYYTSTTSSKAYKEVTQESLKLLDKMLEIK